MLTAAHQAASSAADARRCDANANLLFTWCRDSRYKPALDGDDAPSFLLVEVVPGLDAPSPAASDGRIEIALSNGQRVADAVGRHVLEG